MPIIKSAKKQMRQNAKHRARNFPIRTELKSTFKKALQLIKDGKTAEAKEFLPFAYKIIDMAAKKNIIHQKNAGHKKSRIALALNELEKKGGSAAPEAKAEAEPAPAEPAEEEKVEK
jgi:small subunit ribosomal protein S20